MFFFFEGYGDHRDLHRVDRRQRQMCIRDSSIAVGMSAPSIYSTKKRAAKASPAPRVSIATTGTVSYTHLRAHETPEHLVCRLLLEKKNHTHQTTETHPSQRHISNKNIDNI